MRVLYTERRRNKGRNDHTTIMAGVDKKNEAYFRKLETLLCVSKRNYESLRPVSRLNYGYPDDRGNSCDPTISTGVTGKGLNLDNHL
jgi:hypothetical protein